MSTGIRRWHPLEDAAPPEHTKPALSNLGGFFRFCPGVTASTHPRCAQRCNLPGRHIEPHPGGFFVSSGDAMKLCDLIPKKAKKPQPPKPKQ